LLAANQYHEGYTNYIRDQHFGICTFTKFPIVNRGEILFNKYPNNNFIFTDVLIKEDTVRIYNGHLGSIGFKYLDYEFIGGKGFPKWPDDPPGEFRLIQRLNLAFKDRSEQATIMSDHIKACPYPTIVCCDLNDSPQSYSYATIKGDLEDTFTEKGNGFGSTYIGHFPFLRIDYILHSEKFKPVSFRTFDNNLSDHKAISGIFKIL